MAELKKTPTGKYNSIEVEEYVRSLRTDYEKSLKEQRERIIQLREENRRQKSELSEYVKNERYLSSALIEAEQRAVEILENANVTAQDIQRGAKDKLDFINEKIDEYREKIYEIEDYAIKILQSVILEVSKIREDEIRETPREKLDFNIERIIDTER